MEIEIPDKKLRAAFEDEKLCRKRFGADMAKKIFLRLAVLRAAESLAAFWPPKSGPERCHELIGDRTGFFSIDVKQPYRMLFKASNVKEKADYTDGQEYWKAITSIEIHGIEDTHG